MKMALTDFLYYLGLMAIFNGPFDPLNEYVKTLQMTSDPDTYLTPPQIIRRYGYPVEVYIIPTKDGFLLELERIPYGKSGQKDGDRYPILFVHGYKYSSFEWIANRPGRALAYILADQGYDVWLMNWRGNTFSRSHMNYTPKQKEFWDFTHHEVGVYDLPAIIDFILDKTNQETLLTFGHSMGCTVLFILLSVLPEYNNKISAQINFAPLLVQTEDKKVLNDTLVSTYYSVEQQYRNTPGSYDEHDLLCKLNTALQSAIQFFGYNLNDLQLYLNYGLRPDHLNQEIMPSTYNNFPAGTSVKSHLHVLQFFNNFTYFDYGPEENMRIYGTSQPPPYNVSNIRVPQRVYYANSDPIAGPPDVPNLYAKMPVKAGLIEISDPGFSHMDFVYNKNVNKLLNNDVVEFINYVVHGTNLSPAN